MVLDGTVPPVEKMRIYGKWDLTNKHRDLGCKATMISGYNWNNMLYGFVWKCCWNWLPFGLITGNTIPIINHPNMFHWRCPMFRQTHMKVPKWPQWCFAEWLIQINGCKAHQSTNDRFVCLSNLGTVPLFFGSSRVFPHEAIKLGQESEVAWYTSAENQKEEKSGPDMSWLWKKYFLWVLNIATHFWVNDFFGKSWKIEKYLAWDF